MVLPAQPLHSTQDELDDLGRDDFACEDYTDDDVVSLLEENARLRKLVLSLSEIVLRNVADTH